MKSHQRGCLENKDLTEDNTNRHANMKEESLLSGGRGSLIPRERTTGTK